MCVCACVCHHMSEELRASEPPGWRCRERENLICHGLGRLSAYSSMVPCISGRRTAPWSLGAIHFVAVIHPQSQAGASLTESGSGQVHRYFVHNALSYLSPYYGNLMQPSAAAGSESVSFSFAAHMVLLQQRKQLLGRQYANSCKW